MVSHKIYLTLASTLDFFFRPGYWCACRNNCVLFFSLLECVPSLFPQTRIGSTKSYFFTTKSAFTSSKPITTVFNFNFDGTQHYPLNFFFYSEDQQKKILRYNLFLFLEHLLTHHNYHLYLNAFSSVDLQKLQREVSSLYSDVPSFGAPVSFLFKYVDGFTLYFFLINWPIKAFQVIYRLKEAYYKTPYSLAFNKLGLARKTLLWALHTVVNIGFLSYGVQFFAKATQENPLLYNILGLFSWAKLFLNFQTESNKFTPAYPTKSVFCSFPLHMAILLTLIFNLDVLKHYYSELQQVHNSFHIFAAQAESANEFPAHATSSISETQFLEQVSRFLVSFFLDEFVIFYMSNTSVLNGLNAATFFQLNNAFRTPADEQESPQTPLAYVTKLHTKPRGKFAKSTPLFPAAATKNKILVKKMFMYSPSAIVEIRNLFLFKTGLWPHNSATADRANGVPEAVPKALIKYWQSGVPRLTPPFYNYMVEVYDTQLTFLFLDLQFSLFTQLVNSQVSLTQQLRSPFYQRQLIHTILRKVPYWQVLHIKLSKGILLKYIILYFVNVLPESWYKKNIALFDQLSVLLRVDRRIQTHFAWRELLTLYLYDAVILNKYPTLNVFCAFRSALRKNYYQHGLGQNETIIFLFYLLVSNDFIRAHFSSMWHFYMQTAAASGRSHHIRQVNYFETLTIKTLPSAEYLGYSYQVSRICLVSYLYDDFLRFVFITDKAFFHKMRAVQFQGFYTQYAPERITTTTQLFYANFDQWFFSE